MKEYKHFQGDLLEVTREYKVRFIDMERAYFLGDHEILIADDLSRIIYWNPITQQQSSLKLSTDTENSNSHWDWDLTDGKLSLKQSILGGDGGGTPYHFYLRDNKFYPCYMRNYQEWSAKDVQGWDGKLIK